MPDPAHALTLQFLAWIAESPRTYAQAMDAWRSTCPLCAFKDNTG